MNRHLERAQRTTSLQWMPCGGFQEAHAGVVRIFPLHACACSMTCMTPCTERLLTGYTCQQSPSPCKGAVHAVPCRSGTPERHPSVSLNLGRKNGQTGYEGPVSLFPVHLLLLTRDDSAPLQDTFHKSSANHHLLLHRGTAGLLDHSSMQSCSQGDYPL